MFTGISNLMASYLMGAMVLLIVALVYWADAIRSKKEKGR